MAIDFRDHGGLLAVVGGLAFLSGGSRFFGIATIIEAVLLLTLSPIWERLRPPESSD